MAQLPAPGEMEGGSNQTMQTHASHALPPGHGWTGWDLLICGAPLLAIALYAVGLWRLWKRAGPGVGVRWWEARPALRRGWRWLTARLTVVLVHGAVVWVWQVPVLFEAALHSDSVHAVQHFGFFWTAAWGDFPGHRAGAVCGLARRGGTTGGVGRQACSKLCRLYRCVQPWYSAFAIHTAEQADSRRAS